MLSAVGSTRFDRTLVSYLPNFVYAIAQKPKWVSKPNFIFISSKIKNWLDFG